MEKRGRTEAVHGEIHLHEVIIQHIQSFLSSKEAAKTSILSKTWYNAWATRPLLDLDQLYIQCRGGADGFLQYSKEIMRRYEESKLKIENFRFCMENIESDSFSSVNELILYAMKLGACDLNFEILKRNLEFDLRKEALRSENLVRLSLSGCRIDIDAMGGKMGFSKLKSLSLRGVGTVGFSTFDIASKFPLIEDLVLSNCTSIYTNSSSNGNSVETRGVLLLTSLTQIEKQSFVMANSPKLPYDNLKCLYLESIQIDALLFSNMLKSFPCLKDLTLKYCLKAFFKFQICSHSLEFLSITQKSLILAELDVPSLRKFTISSANFPHLRFQATSREWESYISIKHLENGISSYWLSDLKKLLMQLSLSKISLSLYFGILTVNGLDHEEHTPMLPKPEVENLMLSMRAPTTFCSSLLKRVVWTCRPKIITYGWLPQLCVEGEENSDARRLLCKTLIEEQSKSCCIKSQHMFDKYGLEKVDVEVFEESLAQWRTLPWKALVDASKSLEKKQKTRFKLRWR